MSTPKEKVIKYPMYSKGAVSSSGKARKKGTKTELAKIRLKSIFD